MMLKYLEKTVQMSAVYFEVYFFKKIKLIEGWTDIPQSKQSKMLMVESRLCVCKWSLSNSFNFVVCLNIFRIKCLGKCLCFPTLTTFFEQLSNSQSHLDQKSELLRHLPRGTIGGSNETRRLSDTGLTHSQGPWVGETITPRVSGNFWLSDWLSDFMVLLLRASLRLGWVHPGHQNDQGKKNEEGLTVTNKAFSPEQRSPPMARDSPLPSPCAPCPGRLSSGGRPRRWAACLRTLSRCAPSSQSVLPPRPPPVRATSAKRPSGSQEIHQRSPHPVLWQGSLPIQKINTNKYL